MIFSHLRTTEWHPSFVWLNTIEEAANQINIWHEDYPQRVAATTSVLDSLLGRLPRINLFRTSLLIDIHKTIFPDLAFEQFRAIDVRVGSHRPVKASLVSSMMIELEEYYAKQILDLDVLKEWYKDFETIHPFRDGNGRTSGVIVAVGSHKLTGKFWAPNQ